MLNHKSAKKGEIATLLTLGLVVVGVAITLVSSILVNKQKNIASNPRAAVVNCIYNSNNICKPECTNSNNDCVKCKNNKYRCRGTTDDSPTAPTNTPIPATGCGSGGQYPCNHPDINKDVCEGPNLEFACCVKDNYLCEGKPRYRWYGCTGQPCVNTKIKNVYGTLFGCPAGVNPGNPESCGEPTPTSPPTETSPRAGCEHTLNFAECKDRGRDFGETWSYIVDKEGKKWCCPQEVIDYCNENNGFCSKDKEDCNYGQITDLTSVNYCKSIGMKVCCKKSVAPPPPPADSEKVQSECIPINCPDGTTGEPYYTIKIKNYDWYYVNKADCVNKTTDCGTDCGVGSVGQNYIKNKVCKVEGQSPGTGGGTAAPVPPTETPTPTPTIEFKKCIPRTCEGFNIQYWVYCDNLNYCNYYADENSCTASSKTIDIKNWCNIQRRDISVTVQFERKTNETFDFDARNPEVKITVIKDAGKENQSRSDKIINNLDFDPEEFTIFGNSYSHFKAYALVKTNSGSYKTFSAVDQASPGNNNFVELTIGL